MRHVADDECGKDAIGARKCHCRRHELIEHKEHGADEQEKRELKEYRESARYQRELRLAFAARGKQTLHNELICSMAGSGKKRTADNARPECVVCGEVPRKIEDAEFICISCDGANHGPAA